jgi:hypothetical protein
MTRAVDDDTRIELLFPFSNGSRINEPNSFKKNCSAMMTNYVRKMTMLSIRLHLDDRFGGKKKENEKSLLCLRDVNGKENEGRKEGRKDDVAIFSLWLSNR